MGLPPPELYMLSAVAARRSEVVMVRSIAVGGILVVFFAIEALFAVISCSITLNEIF